MLSQRVQSVKTHLRENKTAYISGGVCLVVGAAGTLFVAYKLEAIVIVDSWKIQINSPTTNNVITILERRGHPGYLVRCKETGEVFASQNRAAELMGINAGDLCSHLNGKFAHAGGHTFERLGEAK